MKEFTDKAAWPLYFLVCALMWGVLGCKQSNTYAPPPPPEVTVSHPIKKMLTEYRIYTGTTTGIEQVQIQARIEGFLDSMHFTPGQKVKAGDLLFVIEPRPYEAALMQAKASLAVADAERQLAQATLSRKQGAFADKAVSEIDVLTARAQLKGAEAGVEAAKAKIEQAAINLSYTEVRSPIAGTVDRNYIDVGNLVGAGGERSLLTTVINSSSVFAFVFISENDMIEYLRKNPDRERRRDVKIGMAISGDEGFPYTGKADFVENRVNPATGTIEVRFVFDDPGPLVQSGMFVRLRLPFSEPEERLTIPEKAIGRDQQGAFVYVVDQNDTVRYQSVKLGFQAEELRVVESGLTEEDLIIVDGLLRARPGGQVRPTSATSKAQNAETATGS